MPTEIKTEDGKIHVEDFVAKLKEAMSQTEEKEVHVFNNKEVKILQDMIRVFMFIQSLGIFGSIVLKVMLWGVAMVGAFAAYQSYFVGK